MADSPKRLLFVAHDAGIGGAQLSLAEVLKRALSEGMIPTVILPTPGPFISLLRKLGIKEYFWGIAQRWIFFKKPAGEVLRHPYFWAIASLITLPLRLPILVFVAKTHNIDLIYTNTITTIDGALVARILSLPHIWHIHESISGNPSLTTFFPITWLPKFILNWSDRVILSSTHLKETIFCGLNNKKICVITNGVEISEFNISPESVLTDIPQNTPIIAIIGQLTEGKGVNDYIYAARLLREKYPECHHLIIGNGNSNSEKKFKSLTYDLGMCDRVHFLGYRDDIPALLSRIDILVSASHHESFGRTLIEGMAAGKPTIATRCGGPEEIIIDGESGLLVSPGDSIEMARKMDKLLSDKTLALYIGCNGRLRVEKFFNLKSNLDQTIRIINEAINSRTKSRNKK